MAIGTTAALVLGGAALAKGGMSYMSARAKRNAEKKAAAKAGTIQQGGTDQAVGALNQGYDAAHLALGQGYEKSRGAMSEWNAKAGQSLTSGRDLARGDLNAGFDQGRTDLSAGYDRARGGLQSMADLSHYGEDAITGKGFETSAGYGFRLGQGQSALDRMSAASGGRLSGAALKKAMEYNQGFASNEYGNWANRASDLGRVGYNALGQQAGYMADEGRGLSGLSVARGGALGQLESNYGGQMSSLNERYGNNLANSYGQQGTQQANLSTGGASALANAYTGNANNQANLQFAGNSQEGAGYDAAGNFIGDLGQIGAVYDWSQFGGGSSPAPSGGGKMSSQQLQLDPTLVRSFGG